MEQETGLELGPQSNLLAEYCHAILYASISKLYRQDEQHTKPIERHQSVLSRSAVHIKTAVEAWDVL